MQRDYSRTAYTFGYNYLKAMQEAKFLVIGFDGVGSEIVKNLVLTGSYVSIFDNQIVQEQDLSVNPFLRQEDVGKQRQVCLNRIQELNPVKEVKWINNIEISYDKNNNYNTIIYCQNNEYQLQQIAKLARENNIYFVSAQQFSLIGQIFVDFGNQFKISDQDGEKYDINVVSQLMFSKDGIYCMSKDLLDFSYGDIIKLSDIQMGDDQLSQQCQYLMNDKEFKVQPTSQTAFQILLEGHSDLYNLISNYGNELQYIRGGNFIRIKIPKIMNFQSYEQQIQQPSIDQNIIDFNKIDQQQKQFEIFKQFNMGQQIQENDSYQKYIKYTQSVQFSPICSIIGSWASQEALKSVTGQYTPINQFALFDCMEIVDFGNNIDFSSNSFQSKNNIQKLFDGIILQNQQLFSQILKQQNTFIVGAGALGCEIIKHFALNKIDNFTVTDNDKIENSNLSRQFLFREEDNQQYKSEVAIKRWKQISQMDNAQFLIEKISPQNPLKNQFWKSKTVVINALDNINARKFVDQKCIEYELPLLESGTLGSKANMQVIIPHLTKTYGETEDPDSKEEALCTIHNTPSKMSHCIQYAQNEFKGIFEIGSVELQKLKEKGPQEYINYLEQSGNKFQCLYAIYSLIYPLTTGSIENAGKILYNRYFIDLITQLLELTPLDAKNQDGTLFWSGDKRPPKPISFDMNQQYCRQFLDCYISIIQQIIQNIPINDINKGQVKMLNSSELNKETTDDQNFVQNIINESYKLICDKQINQLVFEKDNDQLKHVKFLSAFSNLRAMNYNIKTVDDEEIRRIAGKITPAIVTTTSAIVGHVMVEFMKLILKQAGYKKAQQIDFYKSVFMNLALPMCQIVENQEKTILPNKDQKFDLWDRFEVDKSYTIQQVIDLVQQLYGSVLDGANYGIKSIFMSFMCNNFDEKLEDIFKKLDINVLSGESIMCQCIAEEDDEYLPFMIVKGF